MPPGPLARSVIAHEIGHHYGLDDRYFFKQTFLGLEAECNLYENTVMDTLVPNDPNYPGCPWRDTPTKLDISRVDMFWRGGTPLPNMETRGDLPILVNAVGPVATYRWFDMAWAEKDQLIVFQYLDPDPPWGWIDFAQTSSPYWGGVHMYIEPRTVTMEIDVRNYPSSIIPDTSTHRACTWAYYAGAGYQYGSDNGYGNEKCSNTVVLTRPPP